MENKPINNDTLQRLFLFATQYNFREGEILKCISNNDVSKGRYLISNYGDLAISLCRNQWIQLKFDTDKDGYLRIRPSKTSQEMKCYLHREVAKLFVPNDNPEEKTVVHHIDGNKHNNHYTNLVWMNKAEHDKMPRKKHKDDENIQENLFAVQGNKEN